MFLRKWKKISAYLQIYHKIELKNQLVTKIVRPYPHLPNMAFQGWVVKGSTEGRNKVITVGRYYFARIHLSEHTREVKEGEYVYLFVTLSPRNFFQRTFLIGKLITKEEHDAIEQAQRLVSKVALLCRRRPAETFVKIKQDLEAYGKQYYINHNETDNLYASDTEEVKDEDSKQ